MNDADSKKPTVFDEYMKGVVGNDICTVYGCRPDSKLCCACGIECDSRRGNC